MNNPITPRISELIGRTDDELRELLSELNNASLRKLAREMAYEIKDQRLYILEQQGTIKKMSDRLYNISKLAEKEVE